MGLIQSRGDDTPIPVEEDMQFRSSRLNMVTLLENRPASGNINSTEYKYIHTQLHKHTHD